MQILRILTISLIFVPNIIMASVQYQVNFTEAAAKKHQVEVEITVDKIHHTISDYVHFKVPVWTPGSYKVREFSQHFEVLSAKVNDKEVEVKRGDKNTWLIPASAKDKVSVVYSVYAFEQSVRQSYIDEYYAFLHGVSAFGYIEENLNDELTVQFNPLSSWSDVYMAANEVKGKAHTFKLRNYDLLADSPIALGNFDTVDYTSGDVPHKVVMIGEGNYDLNKIKADFKKINDAEVEIFGSHPSEPIYIHFIYNVNSGGGGLEHLNCQTSMIERNAYTDEAKYKKFLGLIAHEYFHLWNVKRIKPKELGPFDYDKENYTDLLWVAEGFTSYYDDLTLLRTGIIDTKEYLSLVAAQINRYENTPGKEVMNLQESSRLAWIKAYLPHENSHNTTISYYNKGMLVALAMDLRIHRNSNGKSSLDQLLKALYERYNDNDLLSNEKGFDLDIIKSLCKDLYNDDMSDLFDELIFGKGEINYTKWFEGMGVAIENKTEADKAYVGISGDLNSGKFLVSRIDTDSPAEKAGISVKDEIIAINGWRVDSDLSTELKDIKVGEEIAVLISRDGKVIELKMTLAADEGFNYSLSVSDEDNKILKQWLDQD